MGDLSIVNVDESTTDDETRQFLCNYGFPPHASIQRCPAPASIRLRS